MSDLSASPAQRQPLIAKRIAKTATPARREMTQIAAFDLHRAAKAHAHIGLGRAADWYIPQLAILQVFALMSPRTARPPGTVS